MPARQDRQLIAKTIRISNKLGLHARSAAKFVAVAQQFSATVKVSNAHGSANGKSIMNMLLLQARCGSEIDITIDGDGELQSMQALVELIEQKFGEAE